MDINNLEPLIVLNDITSNVQIVVNYLNYKKNNLIDSKGLFFLNLLYTEESLEEYDNVLTIIKENYDDDARVLSQQECEQLINEEITKFYKNPTYYQKRNYMTRILVIMEWMRNMMKMNLFKRQMILSQWTIVSFDQIKKSFVFINEDKMSFSIITNCNHFSNEYAL